MEPADAVVKGWTYDHLIGQFGKDAASVGFAVVLDELMLALSRQKIVFRQMKKQRWCFMNRSIAVQPSAQPMH